MEKVQKLVMGLQAIDGDALSDKSARIMAVSRWTREIEDSKLAGDGAARAIQMSLSSMAGPHTQVPWLCLPISSSLFDPYHCQP